MCSRVKGGVFVHSCASKKGKGTRLKGWCDLKKKLTIVVMVVLAAILIASPVLAAGSSHPMEVAKKQPTVISMTGKIVGEDRSGTEIDVLIQMTNRAFIQYRGQTKSVDISDALCVEWVNGKKSETIDCGSLGTGDKVSIIARVDPQTKDFTARRVQLKQPRIQVP